MGIKEIISLTTKTTLFYFYIQYIYIWVTMKDILQSFSKSCSTSILCFYFWKKIRCSKYNIINGLNAYFYWKKLWKKIPIENSALYIAWEMGHVDYKEQKFISSIKEYIYKNTVLKIKKWGSLVFNFDLLILGIDIFE